MSDKRYVPYDYYDYAAQNDRSRSEDQIDRSGYGGHKLACCPLVVDPLTLFALLGFIAAATAFLNVLITMNIMAPGRKRRKRDLSSTIKEG